MGRLHHHHLVSSTLVIMLLLITAQAYIEEAQEEVVDTFRSYLPCSSILQLEPDQKYFFRSDFYSHYSGSRRIRESESAILVKNHDAPHPHDVSQVEVAHGYGDHPELLRIPRGRGRSLTACTWTFRSSGQCQLMVHFNHYYVGDRRCSKQYILVTDDMSEVQACSTRGLPRAFESATGVIKVKHYRRRHTIISEFEGYAICHSTGAGEGLVSDDPVEEMDVGDDEEETYAEGSVVAPDVPEEDSRPPMEDTMSKADDLPPEVDPSYVPGSSPNSNYNSTQGSQVTPTGSQYPYGKIPGSRRNSTQRDYSYGGGHYSGGRKPYRKPRPGGSAYPYRPYSNQDVPPQRPVHYFYSSDTSSQAYPGVYNNPQQYNTSEVIVSYPAKAPVGEGNPESSVGNYESQPAPPQTVYPINPTSAAPTMGGTNMPGEESYPEGQDPGVGIPAGPENENMH